VINSTLDMSEVLSLIAENATKLMGMMASSIRLLDPNGDKLYVGGSFGLSPSFVHKGPSFTRLLDRETLERGIVQVLDVASDARFQFREEARLEGIHSALCASISAKNRALGIIRVYSAVPHQFSEQEEALLKNLANLGALAIENARVYAQIKAQSEQRVWIARVTHHQLRAPLAAIQGVLEAVPYAGALTDKQKELLERASRRVQDTFDLIRDLLDLAAAQRPLEEGVVQTIHLDQVLQKIVETAREQANAKGVEFKTILVAGEIVIQAQAADMERIFSNLLDNAVKYTPRGGCVRLEIVFEDGTVRTMISDTGIGIDAADQERIFTGFYRTQAAKDSGEMGTGLGLSIVKCLVDRYGGKLELVSAPGLGSRFIVILPRRIDSHPPVPA
jgi:signal transduction histidine kinase